MSPASLGPHVAGNGRTKLALSPDNPQVPAGGQPERGGSADRPGGLGRFEEAESGEPHCLRVSCQAPPGGRRWPGCTAHVLGMPSESA